MGQGELVRAPLGDKLVPGGKLGHELVLSCTYCGFSTAEHHQGRLTGRWAMGAAQVDERNERSRRVEAVGAVFQHANLVVDASIRPLDLTDRGRRGSRKKESKTLIYYSGHSSRGATNVRSM